MADPGEEKFSKSPKEDFDPLQETTYVKISISVFIYHFSFKCARLRDNCIKLWACILQVNLKQFCKHFSLVGGVVWQVLATLNDIFLHDQRRFYTKSYYYFVISMHALKLNFNCVHSCKPKVLSQQKSYHHF